MNGIISKLINYLSCWDRRGLKQLKKVQIALTADNANMYMLLQNIGDQIHVILEMY